MMNPQIYAVEIEHIMSKVFNCDRFGLSGLVNSDYIRKYPIHSINCALSHLYGKNNHINGEIESFIEKYNFFAQWSIDNILLFETSKQIINGIEYEIPFVHGDLAINTIIEDFKKIVYSDCQA